MPSHFLGKDCRFLLPEPRVDFKDIYCNIQDDWKHEQAGTIFLHWPPPPPPPMTVGALCSRKFRAWLLPAENVGPRLV